MIKKHILIGTHHKTGTVWMNRVFRRFCLQHRVPFVDISELSSESMTARMLQAMDSAYSVFFSHHSVFPDLRAPAFRSRPMRGIHLVRDPRDLLISAARYHCEANEPQLLVPRAEFGGRTYREAIRAIESTEEQILFELDHSGGMNVEAMVSFDPQGIFETARYEDLIVDASLEHWHGVCLRLGLGGTALLHAMESFYAESIFSNRDPVLPASPAFVVTDLVHRARATVRSATARLRSASTRHVRDGSPMQWRSTMTPALMATVELRVGPALDKFGYQRTS